MPYILLAVGLVVLALALFKMAGHARRLAVTRGHVSARMGESAGLVKARMAALRIAVRDRRRVRTIEKSTQA
ncbi:MAG: bacteriophage holin [Kibdelosporangium sp.]